MPRITFTRTHPRFGDFTDAVDVPDGATPEQIEPLIEQRVDAWAAYLANPPAQPAAPDEEVSNGI